MPDEPTPQPEGPEKSLLEQMEDALAEFIANDRKIPGYLRRIDELKFQIEAQRRTIAFRHTFLRRLAAKQIREKHGIKVIPGYNDLGTNVGRAVGQLNERTRKLFEEAGIQLPPALQQPPKKT